MILAVGLVAAPAGAPVGISYVYSDSMEPAIGTGDGFVVVPAGDVEESDIVTFESDHRDEYVTHRVVDETEAGYVTQGDNNQVTDQTVGHPPVQREKVTGAVLTVGNSPLTIPGLGAAVAEASANRSLLLALLAALVGRSAATDGSAVPERPVVHASELFHTLVATGVIVCAVGVLLAGSTIHIPVAQMSDDATPETVTFDDGTETVTFSAPDAPFTHRAVSTTGVRIVDQSTNGQELALRLAPGDIEDGTATVRFYQYPAVLPKSVLLHAHGIHPLVAAILSSVAPFVPVYLLYAALFDGREPLRQTRWRRLHGGDT